MAWRTKANEYTHEIAQAKVNKWKEFVDKADQKTIWQVQKYIANTPTSTFVPTLNEQAAMNDQKVEAFQTAFFPKPPAEDLTDISTATYSEEGPCETELD